MRDLLETAISDLPRVLYVKQWNSVNVNYHFPFVERLWVDWILGHRIYLHRILPAKKETCLFHPHPWPSVMKVIEGDYELGIGWGKGGPQDPPPPVAATVYGSAGMVYEMLDRDSWHYVRPMYQHHPVYTIMVTGQPWQRETPKAPVKLNPLSAEKKDELLLFFKRKFKS